MKLQGKTVTLREQDGTHIDGVPKYKWHTFTDGDDVPGEFIERVKMMGGNVVSPDFITPVSEDVPDEVPQNWTYSKLKALKKAEQEAMLKEFEVPIEKGWKEEDRVSALMDVLGVEDQA